MRRYCAINSPVLMRKKEKEREIKYTRSTPTASEGGTSDASSSFFFFFFYYFFLSTCLFSFLSSFLVSCLFASFLPRIQWWTTFLLQTDELRSSGLQELLPLFFLLSLIPSSLLLSLSLSLFSLLVLPVIRALIECHETCCITYFFTPLLSSLLLDSSFYPLSQHIVVREAN